MSTLKSSNPANSSVGDTHNCVLCSTKLGSKQELQEHFRKHANKEIDNKGKPVKNPYHSSSVTKAATKPTNASQTTVKDVPEPSTSQPARSLRARLPQNASNTTGSKSKRKKSPPSNGVASLQEDKKPERQAANPSQNSLSCSTSQEDRVKCDVCEDTFATVSMAIQHKYRRHRDSKVQNFCLYCGQQFPIKYSLDKHLQSHTEDISQHKDAAPAEQCQICGVAFYKSKALSYHMTSCHNKAASLVKFLQAPPPSRKIKYDMAGQPQSVYYCHLCGAEYIVKYNLVRHLERHLTADEANDVPQELIKCKVCDAMFLNKKAFDNHSNYHNDDDILVESEEQRQALITRVDQDFDYRRVLRPEEKYATKVERAGRSNRRTQNSKQEKRKMGKNKEKKPKSKTKRLKREFAHIDASSSSVESFSDDSSELSSPSPVSDSDDEHNLSIPSSNPILNPQSREASQEMCEPST